MAAVSAAVLVLAGCASISIDQAVESTNQAVPGFTGGKLELSRTDQQRQARERLAAELLAKPLSMDDAVQLIKQEQGVIGGLAERLKGFSAHLSLFAKLKLGGKLGIARPQIAQPTLRRLIADKHAEQHGDRAEQQNNCELEERHFRPRSGSRPPGP
jgi:hypothetical protein